MKLFWCARTRASRVVWMLEELGVAYDREVVDLHDPGARENAEFRLASPLGKVPALDDDGVRIADSAAICLYLADRYGGGKLAPGLDAPQRGRYLYWMFFSPSTMEPAMAEKMGGWKTNPGAYGWGDFDRMIAALESGVEAGPWVLGETFSAADVMVGSTAAFMRMFKILPANGSIDAYVDRCLARPAYQKALALDQSD